MKDSIEDFIKQNRQAFDDEMPSSSVWDNLELELQQEQVTNSGSKILQLKRRFTWAAAAAIVFMAVSIGFWLQNRELKRTEHSSSTLASIEIDTVIPSEDESENDILKLIPEARALNAQYSADLEQYLSQLKNFPEVEEEVKKELEELDDEFSQLQQELGTNMSTEIILEAMIETYRMKLEILERTLNYLKRNNETYSEQNITL